MFKTKYLGAGARWDEEARHDLLRVYTYMDELQAVMDELIAASVMGM